MKPIFSTLITFLIFSFTFFSCKDSTQNLSVQSPDKSIAVSIVDEKGTLAQGKALGALYYMIQANGETLVQPSKLGLIANDQNYVFDQNLIVKAIEFLSAEEVFTMISGKKADFSTSYNQMEVRLINEQGKEISVFLRAFNEGIAFRYVVHGFEQDSLTIIKELTSFAFEKGKKWILPYDKVADWAPAYETYFEKGVAVGKTAPGAEGWSFPVLIESSKHWMLLSESGLDRAYCGTHLEAEARDGCYQIRFPETTEHYNEGISSPKWVLPWQMPWRFIAIGKDLNSIVQNDLVYHLAEPNQLGDDSWVEPGVASWDWWSSTGGRQLDRLKEFVDLSAEFGWKYSLVDAGWERMNGGTLEDLVEYADEKKVSLLLWYNSGGRRRAENKNEIFLMADPDKRRAEFERIHKLGIKGIKVDFFNSDKQLIIDQYLDILEDAADYQLLVNFHGCTLPRGWSRTYPNLLAMEAVRGTECYRFDKDYPEKAVTFNTIIPFTRNVIGPMDYTPVALSDSRYPHITTAAHELATMALYQSGLVHMADKGEAYQKLPGDVKHLISKLPTTWDEVKMLDGYPGSYCVLARRKGTHWWIAGINGKEQRTISLDLSFISGSENAGLIITDGTERDDLKVGKINENHLADMTFSLKPAGGFIMYK